MTAFLVAIAWKTLAVAVVLAVVEHSIHRFTMHRKVWGLHWSYRWHHEQHHAQCQNERHEHLDILLAPYLVAFAAVALFGGWRIYHGAVIGGASGIVATAIVLTVHRVLWNSMHRTMHDTETNWSTRLPWYESFKRHHLEHHRRPLTNYGVIFPVVDRIMGTRGK